MNAPLCIMALALSSGICLAEEFEVRVSGRSDAEVSIVTARIPREFPETGLLKSDQGEIPFQRIGVGELVFVVRGIKNKEDRVYQVVSQPVPATARAKSVDDRVDLTVGDKRVLTYQGAETKLPRPDIKPIFKRGGYIHPIFSPAGKILTDDYPSNHLHHHGVWFPWTKTEFEGRAPDFWNMGDAKGRVEFVRLGNVWSGAVSAGFSAQHQFVDLTSGKPKVALHELWSVRTYNVPGADYHVFDLVSLQTCASGSELKLPKYLYGGLGFRGNWAWNGESQTAFLTSAGETDRVKGNETRGDWCYIGGDVDGERAGITIFCHPSNFRAPQPMRLHPKEPFFCFAPSQLGDWSIESGKEYISRYRFVVQDGPPVKSKLDDLWRGYAHPPEVTITRR